VLLTVRFEVLTEPEAGRIFVTLIRWGMVRNFVCNVNIVYRNFKSEYSQKYAQKPQRNCTFMKSPSRLDGVNLFRHLRIPKSPHRKKRFTSFPSPAGMSLTKLRLGGKNSVMTSLFPPRESLVVTSRLGTGNSRTFFLRCRENMAGYSLLFFFCNFFVPSLFSMYCNCLDVPFSFSLQVSRNSKLHTL
jgi:hypothetical protein